MHIQSKCEEGLKDSSYVLYKDVFVSLTQKRIKKGIIKRKHRGI